MTVACGGLLELIKSSGIHHDGDDTLTTHVLNAVPRYNERGYSFPSVFLSPWFLRSQLQRRFG